jgi:hypothetical protein
MLPIVLAYFVAARTNRDRIVFAAVFALGIGALVLTFSRGRSNRLRGRDHRLICCGGLVGVDLATGACPEQSSLWRLSSR